MPAGFLNRSPDRDRGRAPVRHRQGQLPDLLGVDRPGDGRRQAAAPEHHGDRGGPSRCAARAARTDGHRGQGPVGADGPAPQAPPLSGAHGGRQPRPPDRHQGRAAPGSGQDGERQRRPRLAALRASLERRWGIGDRLEQLEHTLDELEQALRAYAEQRRPPGHLPPRLRFPAGAVRRLLRLCPQRYAAGLGRAAGLAARTRRHPPWPMQPTVVPTGSPSCCSPLPPGSAWCCWRWVWPGSAG